MANSATHELYQMLPSFTPDQVVAALRAFVQHNQGAQSAPPVEVALAVSAAPITQPLKRSAAGKNAVNEAPKSRSKKHRKQVKGSGHLNSMPLPVVNRSARPLNSFIAYRSLYSFLEEIYWLTAVTGYYSKIFSALQQKDISGLLTCLWQADPFKAKWTILAKAYSIIRDSYGKDVSPLKIFLTTNAPFVGVISPDNYLAALGWVISAVDDHCVLQRQHPLNMGSFGKDIVDTEKTVHDVLQHSCEQGYIPASAANLMLHRTASGTQNIMALQIPGQQEKLHKNQLPVVPAQSQPATATTFPKVGGSQHGIAQCVAISGHYIVITKLTGCRMTVSPAISSGGGSMMKSACQNLVNSTERDWELQISDAMTAQMAQTQALEQNQLAANYPSMFNQDIPAFNPFAGDKWDVYDITGQHEAVDWSTFIEEDFLH